jgi:peptidoglycan/LPS O-acetylase OafA/YrhL
MDEGQPELQGPAAPSAGIAVGSAGASEAGSRFLESGDEAGTAPGDRKFRPDVEGLRAIAILLVVLFHANVPRVTGGFVGVDVFFVISGFVITGVLLRENAASGRTRIGAFYGRRSRRILPVATIVIVLTVLASYRWLGFLTGDDTATVARTASLFYANFHFISSGTDYLSSQAPPSALQNFWSLSVEEQFYLVYPALFIIAATLPLKVSVRARLTVLLTLAIAGSFVWSLNQTANDHVAAFFSPFTRAWELALGALVAVSSLWLARIPRTTGAVLSWIGLAGILLAAFLYTSSTSYPGWAASLPVLATALVIAAGCSNPRVGSESLLKFSPFQWLGRLSYSLYLWHWPILILVAQHVGRSLSVQDNLLLVMMALGLSVVSYYLIENPIRHWSFIVKVPLRSIALGLVLIAISLIVATTEIHLHS